MTTITSYKGFDANWQCRGFQYQLGKTYEHEWRVKACEAGFHACEHPLNVFSYYPPAGSRFAVVEQSGELHREGGNDTKVASSKISIRCEVDIAGLVKAAVEYVRQRCKPIDPDSPASSTGDYGAASSTGNRGAASSTGNQGAASSTGNRGAASSTGDYGAASSTGQHGVALAAGFEGRCMGADGNGICLVNRADDGSIRHIRAGIVGQDGLRAGVWYRLDDAGEFVEAA